MTPPSSSQSPNDIHAAIDIGTNSFHMVVARSRSEGGFDVLTIEKEMVRLGQGAGEMKQLTPEAIERGVGALGRMAAVASSYDAMVSAVATSAVREALNRRDFLDRAKAETGVEVEVISGFEEARLIHLGVLQSLPVFDRQLLVVDIGGGSTEFLVGLGREVKAARSLKLGSIRLTERFFAPAPGGSSGDKSMKKRLKKCRNHVRSALAATAHELGSFGHEVAIGSSGTITAIATMIAVARGEDVNQMNGVSFTADELTALVERIAGTDMSQRENIPGLDAKRADIILGGSVLLETIFESFAISAMTVSGYALREGLLFDRLSKQRLDSDSRLTNLRRTNVERLSSGLDPDAAHAHTTARLAVRLFDETVDLHTLTAADRELLEFASLLHNVGLFISHASHHKHSYYVVRNAEQLTGFSEHELELMALVARYHRKGHPTDKHPEFAQLSEDDKRRVRILAGLMRVAIGLDRAHKNVVDDVAAKYRRKRRALEIRPKIRDGVDGQLERFAAQERSSLLAEALDVSVVVEGANVIEASTDEAA